MRWLPLYGQGLVGLGLSRITVATMAYLVAAVCSGSQLINARSILFMMLVAVGCGVGLVAHNHSWIWVLLFLAINGGTCLVSLL